MPANLDENKYLKVPIDQLTEPPNELNQPYKDYWWIVTPEREILFYSIRPNRRRKNSLGAPQCNADERCAEAVRKKLYPTCTIEQIPIVFVPISPDDFL